MQAQSGKRGIDDPGQGLEIIEDQGEGTDIEHLADQTGENVVLATQRPEQTGQRDIDPDQDRGQKPDIT